MRLWTVKRIAQAPELDFDTFSFPLEETCPVPGGFRWVINYGSTQSPPPRGRG